MYTLMKAGERSRVEERFHPQVVTRLRQEIEEAGGREILCTGKVDSEGRVVSVVAVAHGNETAVPALYPYMERGDVVIHNHPRGRLFPSDADIGVASRLGNEGIGFFIIDNAVQHVYVVAEPVHLAERVLLNLKELRNILQPNGKLSSTIPFYEPRPVQEEMLEAIGEAFNEGGICIVEAGTGVGKSLAYLLPAVEWVAHNDERVVVSTATINLQEQLYEKDLPLVLRLLHSDVPVALVKGRGNYLCWTRLEEIREEATLFEEDPSTWDSLRTWAETSPTGARSDLPFPIEDALWSQVCSESDICTGLRCPNRERCFFLKARKQAASAKLLVVNHHLLFSDLAFRIQGIGFESAAVLPPFRKVVFDEAHNIEQSATDLFSETLNRFLVFRVLYRLLRTKGIRRLGLAVKLANRGTSGALIVRMSEEVLRVRETYLTLEQEANRFMGEGGSFRISSNLEDQSSKAFKKLLESLEDFQREALSLAETLEEILQSLSEEDSETPEAYEGRMILYRLKQIASLCQQFQAFSDIRDRVLWGERRRMGTGEPIVEFHSTPLDITQIMQEAVYEPFDTVVFTSATLTVNRSFAFWKGRVGLKEGLSRSLKEYRFDSPFDYRNRVLIGVPTDAPSPDTEKYITFLHSFLVEACQLTEGRALVLFTSYDTLSKVYALVKPELALRRISTYRQGEEERSRLLKRFNEEVSSVLFATDSFWEGIDAPGETLEMVVLCRLPFKVPTDPVQVARMEAIQTKGGNPFLELSLPEAVMKFRQGFGRLMRRSTDRGIVLIPDVRVVKKSYGKLFLSSLPETCRSLKDSSALLMDVENFLARVSAPTSRTVKSSKESNMTE
ncbi:MAG: ATP-dependent DNA helicase [Spirochaetes bacterium]|nr:ATP-dependent DNA helicase [Spirochaetota bacterium]